MYICIYMCIYIYVCVCVCVCVFGVSVYLLPCLIASSGSISILGAA